VEAMALHIAGYFAGRGVQMVGQDFVVDHAGRWYFLEVNLAFGMALLNVTDGDGYPSAGRGFFHAGRVLADAFIVRSRI
jgi:hypothetical protein